MLINTAYLWTRVGRLLVGIAGVLVIVAASAAIVAAVVVATHASSGTHSAHVLATPRSPKGLLGDV